MSEKPATLPVNEIKGFDNNDIFKHALIGYVKISLNNRSEIFFVLMPGKQIGPLKNTHQP